ncbi:hypothetical protein L0665_09250 [Methanogenium marinum]|uniref:Uncharacterized protein n=1 Tax=Methanogenium marinum TaxID=348610 RepID=A0A9Q4KU05_9EURY|nr:hypothetical protein [Methanogenium marinum]MDE4908792.1 hypothetical protein [Methanogenium marinum]
MRIRTKLIPDSSFFICFFDDLEDLMDEPERFGVFSLVVREFCVEIPEHVQYEAGLKNRSYNFSDSISVVSIDDFASGGLPFEPLRLVIDQGEFEVIALSYVHKTTKTGDFMFILDDETARKKVKLFLPVLLDHLTGTIGFMAHLEANNYLTSEFTINILNCIGKSKFRISQKILDSAVRDIEGRRYEQY